MKSQLEAIIRREFLQDGVHGVILFGSAYQHYYRSVGSEKRPRDIDIVIVTDRGPERDSLVREGFDFDVHRYSYEKIMGLVHRRKDLLWIRNFFAAEYFCAPDSILVMFRTMMEHLRQGGPGAFLAPRNRQDDRLVARNYQGKLKVEGEAALAMVAYFQQLVQLNYAWLCRDQDLWPSADPRAVARDIKNRFPDLHRLVETYLGAADSAVRWDCVDRIGFV